MFPSCLRCSAPAAAMMLYSYSDQHMWIEELAASEIPSYALCFDHASRLSPPRGWKLTDRRNVARLFAPLEVA
ncbi:MAG TPA: DUF3499 family protein [Acidimicrobiia bacterium]|nr:DUF3499 family protein [Acidimicrobiia bacterium]